MSFRPNSALVNVGRKRRAVWLMQLDSTRRERSLHHVPQAQQCAGISRSRGKSPGGLSKNCERAASASGPQITF
jgi:hypothetical protein